jgi:hypothetical protein
MSAPTNRAEARDLIRKVLADCDLAERGLREDLEVALADLLMAQRSEAAREASREASDKHERTMDVVFGMVQSARINMESVAAYRHLQKYDPQALSNDDWGFDKYVREAIVDLTKAGDADDRIPF